MSTEFKIVKVEPTTPMIALSWMIGHRCNYDCMYCPPEWHDSTSPIPDLEKLKKAWHSFYEKTKDKGLPYKITFNGGEVTANKNFLPMLEYLKNGQFNIGQLLVITNGSASTNYYKKLAKLVDAITFSVHSEFINEKKFFTTVKEINKIMIRPQKSIHVNIMDEYWNADRIVMYKNWLSKHMVSYTINKIDYTKQTRSTFTLKGVYNLEQI